MRSYHVAVLIFIAASCGDNQEDFFVSDQGPCSELEEATCRADARCQQVYVASPWGGSWPFRCVLLHNNPPADEPECENLDYHGCRTRNDCSPMAWQELGPTDGPEGDPYFRLCETESLAPYHPNR